MANGFGYYFDENMVAFQKGYSGVHGYLAFTLCVFGIAANIANMVVFTRRNMMSPTHAILTALAAADVLMMLSYFVFAFHAYIRGESQKPVPLSYSRAIFELANLHFRKVAYTVSTWTTVAVAVFRVLAVRCRVGSATWCSMSRAKCAIRATCFGAMLCCIPIYMTYTVEPTQEEGEYLLGLSDIVKGDRYLMLRIVSNYQNVLGLIACVALTVSSGLLIGHRLLQQNAEDNTTRMVFAMVLLTLLVQFPALLVQRLAFNLGEGFQFHVMDKLADLFEAGVVFDKSFKFAIYCLMSRQFRKTFVMLFPFVNVRRSETKSESTESMPNTAI